MTKDHVAKEGAAVADAELERALENGSNTALASSKRSKERYQKECLTFRLVLYRFALSAHDSRAARRMELIRECLMHRHRRRVPKTCIVRLASRIVESKPTSTLS